ncbi:hypothetical protein BH09VER1_BH09VER1_36810 [soil metagenome]
MTSAEIEYGGGDSSSSFSRWIIPALIVSILLHVAFWMWARGVTFSSGRETYEQLVPPRAFHLERANIDPKLLAPDPADQKRAALAPEAVKLPDEQVAFQKLMADTDGTPAAPKIDQPTLSDKPTAASTTYKDTANIAQLSGAQSVLEDSQSLQTAILAEKADAGGASLAKLVDPKALTGKALAEAGALSGGKAPGFSNLDSLLAQTGPLSSETAPILMPTDLLFEYDSADLKGAARDSIEKLGTLIRRNPQATFIIEGHTDSFGSDEYNLALSQRRAESVKALLVNSMQIPSEKIEARGYGKSRLIAPASGSIDEQQLNRRVEIVIRAPKAK